jgi:putative RecB family exonuclease
MGPPPNDASLIPEHAMSAANNFPATLVQPDVSTPSRPRLSLTSDIISFRKCRRQYGYFGNDGFVPAQAVQIYFGQMIHQVLDRCHRHYSGLYPNVPLGSFPTDSDIEAYFDEVDQALRAHGVRPASPNVATQAKQVLKTFNRVEGPTLYPRVLDTEYRLEADRNSFVLRGVVDVLATDGNQGREIWDYKGTNMPALGSTSLRDYEWQMSVYAELYKAKAGQYPERAVLYFLNELKESAGDPPITKRPIRSVHVVDFKREGLESDGTPTLVFQGLQNFDVTAADILSCRQSRQWAAPTGSDVPDEKSCDICDIRWNCPSHPTGKYVTRVPA